MASITYGFGNLVDDSGALLTSSASVTIASVTDKAGVAIVSHGATVNTGALPKVSVDYDSVTHGEAWITLSVSQSARTITAANASPAIYAAKDSNALLLSGIVGVTGVSFPTAVPSKEQILAVFYADGGFSALIAESYGFFTFVPPSNYPGNGTLTLMDHTNTNTLATFTIAYDASRNAISRSAQ